MKLNVDDLVEQGLVKKKTYTEGPYKGLSVLKYTKRVFWDNLWEKDPTGRLLECRGTVVDEEDNVIVLPFKKVFNLGENGTTVDPEREVIIPEKINGFMAAATYTEKYGLIISTTGTLDSEYADIARKWIEPKANEVFMQKGSTFLFEICDKSDPHIVEEEEGAYLIGLRRTDSGFLFQEGSLDHLATWLGFKRPTTLKTKLKDIPQTKREGFMVRCAYTEETLCKIKSNHYLAKKAFMRMGRKRIDLAWNNPAEFRKQIDEEFYSLHHYLVDTYTNEEYHTLKEMERRQSIEEYFND